MPTGVLSGSKVCQTGPRARCGGLAPRGATASAHVRSHVPAPTARNQKVNRSIFHGPRPVAAGGRRALAAYPYAHVSRCPQRTSLASRADSDSVRRAHGCTRRVWCDTLSTVLIGLVQFSPGQSAGQILQVSPTLRDAVLWQRPWPARLRAAPPRATLCPLWLCGMR